MTNINSLVNQIEGNWDDITSQIKRRWSKIKDDDLKKMNGSYDELVEKLEEVYGYTQDEIEDKLRIFSDKLKLKEAKNVAHELQEKITDNIEKVWDVFRTKTEDLQEGIYCYVKGNPYRTLSAAGVVIALSVITAKWFNKKDK